MRLLVVEDEPKVAKSLREGLESEGYEVVVEGTGDAGFRRGRTEGFDLILLDLGLPGMGGLEILTALREAGDRIVGDNEPYSGRHSADFTVDHHAETLGLAYAGIEIRQDLIDTESGQQRMADRLAAVLEVVLQDERLFRPFAG